MKKLLIIFGLVAVSVFGVLIIQNNSVSAETTTTTTETTEDNTFWYDGKTYTYTDYQDLVDQIHADIADDLAAQISIEVSEILTVQYYEAIYADVEANLSSILDETELAVYLESFQNQLYDVINSVESSVLGVINVSEVESALGSGVVYKYDSATDLFYLITNYHVIEDYSEVSIRLADESIIDANVLGYDTEVDIAILTFDASEAPNVIVASLGDSDAAVESEFVLAIGNPMGFDFYGSVTLGIISGLDRYVDDNRYVEYIQHDAAINGGNSGGPIFNLSGEVIGINVAKYATVEIEGMGFSIPINLVKDIITRIENNDFTANTIMPRIGADYTFFESSDIIGGNVSVTDITLGSVYYSGYNMSIPNGITSGMILTDVYTDGTLFGELSNGDLIYQIGSYTLTDEVSMLDYLYDHYESGDSVTIYYYNFNNITKTYSSTTSQVTVIFK